MLLLFFESEVALDFAAASSSSKRLLTGYITRPLTRVVNVHTDSWHLRLRSSTPSPELRAKDGFNH